MRNLKFVIDLRYFKPRPCVKNVKSENIFAARQTVSKAIRFWDFSYVTVFETLFKKGENFKLGLCLLIIKA